MKISAPAVEVEVTNQMSEEDLEDDQHEGLDRFEPSPCGNDRNGPAGFYAFEEEMRVKEEKETSPMSQGQGDGRVDNKEDPDVVPRRRRHVYSVVQAAEDVESKKKTFLIRYLIALHGAGNFTFRTEKIIARSAKHLGFNVACLILPNSATITFQHGKPVNHLLNESHTFPLTPGWNCIRMDLLDKLYGDLCNNIIDFDAADQNLLEVEVLLDQP
jgi:hypothetical protein